MEQLIVVFTIAFVILVVIFLIFREINCWYWKINERIGMQEETNRLLKQILTAVKESGNGPYGTSYKKFIIEPVNPKAQDPTEYDTIKKSELNFTEKMYLEVLSYSKEDVIIMSKNDKKFEIISQPNWAKMVENGEASQYFRILLNE